MGRSRATISLEMLIRAGMLAPGETLAVKVGTTTVKGVLGEEGAISLDGNRFASPSAFAQSALCKAGRNRKAAAGWNEVRLPDGRPIDDLRKEYMLQHGVAVNVQTPVSTSALKESIAKGSKQQESKQQGSKQQGSPHTPSKTSEISEVERALRPRRSREEPAASLGLQKGKHSRGASARKPSSGRGRGRARGSVRFVSQSPGNSQLVVRSPKSDGLKEIACQPMSSTKQKEQKVADPVPNDRGQSHSDTAAPKRGMEETPMETSRKRAKPEEKVDVAADVEKAGSNQANGIAVENGVEHPSKKSKKASPVVDNKVVNKEAECIKVPDNDSGHAAEAQSGNPAEKSSKTDPVTGSQHTRVALSAWERQEKAEELKHAKEEGLSYGEWVARSSTSFLADETLDILAAVTLETFNGELTEEERHSLLKMLPECDKEALTKGNNPFKKDVFRSQVLHYRSLLSAGQLEAMATTCWVPQRGRSDKSKALRTKALKQFEAFVSSESLLAVQEGRMTAPDALLGFEVNTEKFSPRKNRKKRDVDNRGELQTE